MRTRARAIALFALLMLGCDAALAPVGQLAFSQDVKNEGLESVTVEPAMIEIRDMFFLACQRHLTARLAARGPGVVEIHVSVAPGENCFPVAGKVPYLARVTALPPGRYTLRVIHGAALKDTVTARAVDVP